MIYDSTLLMMQVLFESWTLVWKTRPSGLMLGSHGVPGQSVQGLYISLHLRFLIFSINVYFSSLATILNTYISKYSHINHKIYSFVIHGFMLKIAHVYKIGA